MVKTDSKNRLHGIDYLESDIIRFEAGLPGFEKLRRFLLVDDEQYAPFEWLYSVDEPDVRFVLVNPVLFRPDYAPRVTRDHLDSLGVRRKEDLRLLSIVTLHPDFHCSTANLAGPILINIADRVGMQLVLDDSRYSVREPILAEGN